MREFEELYREIFKGIFHYIYTLSNDYSLAEDITQDTFLKAYEHLVVHGKILSKSWFYTVSRNQYISTLRKRKFLHKSKHDEEHDDIFLQIEDKAYTPEEYVLNKEHKDFVNDILNQLNESYRTALILREYHGFSLDEIADIIGVKRSYGKQLLYKAREKFKMIYGGKIHDN